MSDIFKLVIVKATTTFIIRESQRKYPYESGGILVGQNLGGCVKVVFATDPGPKAKHRLNGFERDGEYTQQELDKLVRESQGKYDYVGEWHSHPVPVGPSYADKNSLKWISENLSYNQSRPVLIICQRKNKDEWVFSGFEWLDNTIIQLAVVFEEQE